MHLSLCPAIATLDRSLSPIDYDPVTAMNVPSRSALSSRIGDSALASRLAREIEGDVLFDAFSRGRYSTDASIYQIEPIGVVVPKSEADVVSAIGIAADEKIPILPRGAGSSQCGQTVGEALVIDTSKYLDQIFALEVDAATVKAERGLGAWPHQKPEPMCRYRCKPFFSSRVDLAIRRFWPFWVEVHL